MTWARSPRRRRWRWPAAPSTMGTVLDRLGIWRSIVSGVSIFLLASLGLAFAEAAAAASGVCLPSPASGSPTSLRRPCRSSSPGHGGTSGSSSPRSRSPSFRSRRRSALCWGDSCRARLPGDDLQAYRWTLVAGTFIATLGLAPMLLMGRPGAAAGLPDPTAATRGQRSRGTAPGALGHERLCPGRRADGGWGGAWSSPSTTST